ncbi:MAG: glycosyltransferase [Burkholderiaceae bacterium]
MVLDLLQGLPHDEVIRRLQGTDLAVDQLLIGSYGMFAVEAMAAGTPVVCYLREDLVDRYPEKPPIAIASPDDIEEVIRSLASDPSQWASWSARSRRYVENHHDAGRAAQRAARTYRRLQTGLDARMRVEAMSAEERAP